MLKMQWYSLDFATCMCCDISFTMASKHCCNALLPLPAHIMEQSKWRPVSSWIICFQSCRMCVTLCYSCVI